MTADDARRDSRGARRHRSRRRSAGATTTASCEDLFFYVEPSARRGAAAPDVAGRLHTARSRNDIDMTMYRMLLREWMLSLAEAVRRLRERADRRGRPAHRESIFPAHTHAQPAQPTTVAHYLLARRRELERDTVRLRRRLRDDEPQSARRVRHHRHGVSDRSRPHERAAGILGSDRATPTAASRRSTTCSRAPRPRSVLVIGLGRFIQDLLLWSTVEIGYLRLPDGFVQVSSIMPQKRNPVALEHARALSSKALGRARRDRADRRTTRRSATSSIPRTICSRSSRAAFRDATRAVSLLAVDDGGGGVRRRAHARARAAPRWVTVTELADVLVRDHGLSFGRGARDRERRRLSCARAGAGAEPAALPRGRAREAGPSHRLHATADLARILSPENFVDVRRTPADRRRRSSPPPSTTPERA